MKRTTHFSIHKYTFAYTHSPQQRRRLNVRRFSASSVRGGGEGSTSSCVAQEKVMMLAQDQEKLLDEANSVVKEQAFYMKRAVDNENLRDALKHAANMLCELRTSLLSPKNYYELYMQVFHELQHLASFFSDKSRHNRKMSELYESVQHAGNIIPRLYLLTTVGASYIKSMEAPASDILRDMTELCKGVQHPMRGLFLRYYLTQMCKDKLPDTGTEYEEAGGGSVEDAFEFLLTNFTEATRLWVRLQYQGPTKERQRREKERHDLRVLVGANLVRMAQLEGMSNSFYSDVALPKLIDQIVGCKDVIAQQYLLDCVIQVFSDECHIQTLSQLLGGFMRVLPSVDLNPVLVNLMNRLATFVQADPEAVPEGANLFGLLRDHLSELMERGCNKDTTAAAANAQSTPSAAPTLNSLLELQVAFLSFSLTLYPDRVDYVDVILESTVRLVRNVLLPAEKLTGSSVGPVVDLLSIPLQSLSLSILEMEHYNSLMNVLNFQTRKQVAISMVNAVLEANTPLDDPSATQRFFTFIAPLIRDEEDTPVENNQISDEFVHEQQQIAKLVHAVKNDDPDIAFKLYSIARHSFGEGGPKRMIYTLPSLVVAALKLAPNIHQREVCSTTLADLPATAVPLKKVFQFVHTTCSELVSCAPETALRLFLLAAVACDKLQDSRALEPICYEFLTQALVCYEEELTDSRSQFQGLTMMVGTLSSHISNLDPENYDNLAQKIVQHSAKLLKKPDQCRAILLCTHLFWNNAGCRDGRRVLECLQKSIKVANIVVQSAATHVSLFTDILDKYIYYYEKENHEITVEYIQQLVLLCVNHVKYAESDIGAETRKNLANTISFLKSQTEMDHPQKYHGLVLGLEDFDLVTG